jgi:hypothetical protein
MLEGSSLIGGTGANRGGGRSGGKRSMYEDLDASQSSDWPLLSDSGIGSRSGSSSSSQKRSKHADA